MNPPMSWDRVDRIIHHIRVYGLPKTRGQWRYLQHEVDRMNLYQRTRFNRHCSIIMEGR